MADEPSPSPEPAEAFPSRVSLIRRTADVLRTGLESGRWSGTLPGERTLAGQLRVSRPTIRAAFNQLEHEGLIVTEQGRNRRVIRLPASGQEEANRTIALLSPQPLESIPSLALFWIDELRSRLSSRGWNLEVLSRPGVFQSQPERALARLVESERAAAWVLFVSSESMQRWFAQRGIPALVVGSSPSDNPLPSVDVDYRAACRHAAQWLTRHTRAAPVFLLPASDTPGDRESEEGFQEGAPAAILAHHDESVDSVCHLLDRFLAEGRDSFLVARSGHALTALTHLMRRGVALPDRIRLISRDDDPALRFAVPALARYSIDPALFARRAGEALTQLLEQPGTLVRPVRIIPEFIRGRTAG